MLMNIDEPNWILGQSQGRALDALRELGLVFDALVWAQPIGNAAKGDDAAARPSICGQPFWLPGYRQR